MIINHPPVGGGVGLFDLDGKGALNALLSLAPCPAPCAGGRFLPPVFLRFDK
jgi:hypothetical protein